MSLFNFLGDEIILLNTFHKHSNETSSRQFEQVHKEASYRALLGLVEFPLGRSAKILHTKAIKMVIQQHEGLQCANNHKSQIPYLDAWSRISSHGLEKHNTQGDGSSIWRMYKEEENLPLFPEQQELCLLVLLRMLQTHRRALPSCSFF